ncbi:MAG: methyltransferase domain-containing protein [Planctomycetota bacterium]
MLTAEAESADTLTPSGGDTPEKPVVLADGSPVELAGMGRERLEQLQWEQEQQFAAAILAAPARSPERSAVVAQAYDTVCAILAAQQERSGEPLVMGFDRRYLDLVVRLLARQFESGVERPTLFEIGYGCGALLQGVRERGFDVAGIEVSATMREQCVAQLGEKHASRLLLGDLRDVEPESLDPRPTLVYWNDVLEHLAPDEAGDYARAIWRLLPEGGSLVTITPHWLLRPSDVTGDFCPPRSEARGLHLKEYRLSEVTSLLRSAGFTRVATPLLVTKGRMLLAGDGLRVLKQACEDRLDRLPVRMAHLACRGLGLSVTVATKS